MVNDEPAVSQKTVIRNERGLHARASAKFCAEAAAWNAVVRVEKDGLSVGGCSIMGLLTLAAATGATVTVSASGPEAREAVAALVSLIENKFGEDA
ncbi:MAG: HPr family phosphocarrier protein [Pseudomonadota bacterium]